MVTPEVTYAQNMYSTVYWRKAKEINAPDHGKNKNLEMIEREYVRMHQVLCFPVNGTIFNFYKNRLPD